MGERSFVLVPSSDCTLLTFGLRSRPGNKSLVMVLALWTNGDVTLLRYPLHNKMNGAMVNVRAPRADRISLVREYDFYASEQPKRDWAPIPEVLRLTCVRCCKLRR